MISKYDVTNISYYSNAHQRTKDLLTKHREDVEKVAKLLLEREVITRYIPCRTLISNSTERSNDLVGRI